MYRERVSQQMPAMLECHYSKVITGRSH